MRYVGWKIIPIISFIVLCIFFWRGLSLDPHHLPSVQIGRALPNFSLPSLENPQISFSSTQLPHKVLLLNVWASWCEACIEEQAFMMQLAASGVPIYGLNYKDKTENAKVWLKQWGNPYLSIFQDKKGRTAIDLGVYGAPETFIIDKKGIIRYRQVGVIKEEIWFKSMLPLMKSLEQEA